MTKIAKTFSSVLTLLLYEKKNRLNCFRYFNDFFNEARKIIIIILTIPNQFYQLAKTIFSLKI